MSKKYRIGLALSGGVFRGVAHVGVFQALKENGIEPDAIIGTSAGAIAGGLIAAGKTSEQMLDFVRNWAWARAVRPGIPIDGFSSLSFLKEHLFKHIGHDSFDKLPKSLYVSVTNMNEGKLEILNTGSLTNVIMASCSIPLVFKPVEMNNTIYSDGGVMSNMAIEPLRSECEVLIGVDVMAQGAVESKMLNNVLGIAQRTFYLSIIANSQRAVDNCDIAIKPALGGYHIFNILTKDFVNLYAAGYDATMAKMPEIKALIEERLT